MFFFSEEAFTPGASEGGLYQYEEAHIHLLAASHIEAGAPNVTFLDASETGSDVFFRTTAELVPNDEDQLGDIYDARVNGQVPPKAPRTCVAEACEGEATPPFASPPSATTGVGPSGNLAPPVSPPTSKPKPLTRAQTLARALKACKSKPKNKRASCEARAHKKYGPLRKSKTGNRRVK